MSDSGLGKKQLVIGAAVLVLSVGIGLVINGTSSSNDKRALIIEHVNAIRDAQITHYNKYVVYVTSDWTPQSRFTVGSTPKPWRSSPGFQELRWAPTNDPYAAYRVLLTPSGFVVEAVADVDGDGIPLRIKATETDSASVVTDSSIY